jgi:hypothetical protein
MSVALAKYNAARSLRAALPVIELHSAVRLAGGLARCGSGKDN